jgi:hypothetical protein
MAFQSALALSRVSANQSSAHAPMAVLPSPCEPRPDARLWVAIAPSSSSWYAVGCSPSGKVTRSWSHATESSQLATVAAGRVQVEPLHRCHGHRPGRPRHDRTAETCAPPQLAWEFVTQPGRRLGWQAGTTEIIVSNDQGGRRGVGTTNHCMHGKDAAIEEIVDWRPYDYLTEWTTMGTPMGPVRFLSTVEFDPRRDHRPLPVRAAEDRQGARHHARGGPGDSVIDVAVAKP